jgi:hypothetical protein
MGETPYEAGKDPRLFLPPCEQAQADGVPCTELGRDCEVCEHACEEWRNFCKSQGDGDPG